MSVVLTPDVLDTLTRHARACAPAEACGLLTRRTGSAAISSFAPIPNLAAARRRFAMDPITVLAALRRVRSDGHELAAVFHSHPAGRAVPSDADLSSAKHWPGVLQVIRGADGTIGVFDADGRPQETPA